jgi:hypothetical protein
MDKKIEKVCQNCSLYSKEHSTCGVTIIQDGELHEITTKPDDECVWEEMGIQVNQIRVWSDGKNGYIEYPSYLHEETPNPDSPDDE